jgi:cobyrinic acid a,c-diamide synthase
LAPSSHIHAPRLVIGGLSGDSGKTLVSLGLLLAAASRGIPVRAFKKGPDYIDAAWLRWASGRPAFNLDTFLMGRETAVLSFARRSLADGLNVVEGNRGLYDGVDAKGTHSTAELAKALGAPVLLVVSATKVTRTVAAHVLGCQKLDPEVRVAGVILNRVNSARHERVMREAIESACGIPVLGVLPKANPDALLPGRHLGLVTPEEHPCVQALRGNLLELIEGRLETDRIFEFAGRAAPLASPPAPPAPRPGGRGLRIGYVSDSAFTFYYPENLESLAEAGAGLVPVSALTAGELPAGIHALYIGGGFPETHGAALSGNRSFLESLRRAADSGMPVYAECGGLMLLSRAIRWRGVEYPMAGVLPFEVEVTPQQQGHGYSVLEVDRENPFYPAGLTLKGHEFHYSRLRVNGGSPPTVCAVRRGTGCGDGRDGLVLRNVWASYTHVHALGTPEWTAGMLKTARAYGG